MVFSSKLAQHARAQVMSRPFGRTSVAISDALILISLFRHVKAHRCVAFFVFISYRSAKENSILGSKFMDIPNGNGRWLSWRNRIGRCRDRRRFQESLEAGRREHEEIVVFGVARITQLVGDVARSDESIALLKNIDLVSDGDLQFSSENIVDLILTRMRMTRYTHPRRETHLKEAVFSSGIFA